MENEQELHCQTISMGTFFDVIKKEVLEIFFLVWKNVQTLKIILTGLSVVFSLGNQAFNFTQKLAVW